MNIRGTLKFVFFFWLQEERLSFDYNHLTHFEKVISYILKNII